MQQAKGIDISKHNGVVDFAKVKASGVSFLYAKATEGRAYVDPTWSANRAGALAAGLYLGAYHFFRPAGPALAQAEDFIKTVREVGPTELPPALDIEVVDGVSSQALCGGAELWLREVERRLGVRPIIYTSPSFAKEHRLGAVLGGYDLWIAHWSAKTPEVPAGWNGWRFHQTNNKGKVPGIAGDVDLNTFHGGIPDLINWSKDARL